MLLDKVNQKQKNFLDLYNKTFNVSNTFASLILQNLMEILNAKKASMVKELDDNFQKLKSRIKTELEFPSSLANDLTTWKIE